MHISISNILMAFFYQASEGAQNKGPFKRRMQIILVLKRNQGF